MEFPAATIATTENIKIADKKSLGSDFHHGHEKTI
jgi:hypothetical protein